MSNESAGDLGRANVSFVRLIAQRVAAFGVADSLRRVRRIVNATGVVLHTGLGRAGLSQAAQEAMHVASGACNLEIDLETGERGTRGAAFTEMFQTLTGCEDALCVNNNAGATLLTLQALAAGREVILSRGQLVEIGGSFRLPEIFAASGARLREVGTTNRTRLSDYEQAIGPDTAAILRVHPSNYRIVGFADAPSIRELVELGRSRGLPVIDDIGSGSLLDLGPHGFPEEPSFQESLAAGADLVLGSGDKLMGGPQAGVILGRRPLVEALRRRPLARALRLDKMRIAALEATLEAFLRGDALATIPTLSLLTQPVGLLEARARRIEERCRTLSGLTVQAASDVAPVGGGALPGSNRETRVLRVRRDGESVEITARRLRTGEIGLFPRLKEDAVVIDLRSVPEDDDALILSALERLAEPRPATDR